MPYRRLIVRKPPAPLPPPSANRPVVAGIRPCGLALQADAAAPASTVRVSISPDAKPATVEPKPATILQRVRPVLVLQERAGLYSNRRSHVCHLGPLSEQRSLSEWQKGSACRFVPMPVPCRRCSIW